MGVYMFFKLLTIILLQARTITMWTDYQTVNVLAYTRMRGNGSIDQGVVVMVNDAIFAYFDKSKQTFVLRPSAPKGFSVLNDNDQFFCMSEVLRGFNAQEQYLYRLKEQTSSTRSILVRPSVNVYAQFPESEGQANILYCYVTGFYPGDIEIDFFINGRESTAEGVMSDLMYRDDWTFKVYKYITVTPQRGDEYTCKVKHRSMEEPKLSMWRPEFSQSTLSYYWLFGFVGITCGIVLSSIMYCFFKRRFNVNRDGE